MAPDLLEPTGEIQELCAFVARDLHEVRQLILSSEASSRLLRVARSVSKTQIPYGRRIGGVVSQREPTIVDGTSIHIPFPSTGSYPARQGSALRPLVDGEPAFRRIGEAIEAARHSVWLTVAFFAPDFQMPDGRGSLFDVLDRAAARGLDVRVIFWRSNLESDGYGRTFPGSQSDRDMLDARRSQFFARWDRAPGAFVQHQKSWLLDAGQPTEIAFVGGINLTARAVGSPGHNGEGERHDVYVEICGPSATDVHHNFVQRWNEASERESADGRWGRDADDQLPLPTRLSVPRGHRLVHIRRNVHAGRYTDGRAGPGSVPYKIVDGERTIFDQYLLAINAAREGIYIENQAVLVPPIAAALEEALRRKVDVVALVPAEPEAHVRAARRNPERRSLFDQVGRLGQYEHFGLIGIAGLNAQGERRDVYVHGKIMRSMTCGRRSARATCILTPCMATPR
jgi:cardiolipin synthase A/B